MLPKLVLRGAVIYIVFVVSMMVLLQDRTYTKPYGAPITVALLQGNVPQGAKWHDYHNGLKTYANMIYNAPLSDIIILPETAITQYEEYLPHNYLQSLTDEVHRHNEALIIGIPKIVSNTNQYVNAAVLISESNHPYYAKAHLVPYGEYIPLGNLLASVYKLISLPMVGFSAGSLNQMPLLVKNQKLAFNICYENGFASELIINAKNATLMVNLSDMVWYGSSIAKDEHLQISQARALENQRYFIQSTNTGMTAIIKPNGEIQAQLPSFVEATLRDQVEGRVGTTLFELLGNYPIIIFSILVIAITIPKVFFPKNILKK